jgi:outer membrane protein assembly factor BamB
MRTQDLCSTLRQTRRGPVLAVAVLAVGALLFSSCDWTMWRYGPEGTGFNPGESTISASNVSGLQWRWTESSQTGQTGLPSESSPAVANGFLYATSSNGKLDAFDASNGTGKWSYQMGSSARTLSPAVDNGVVYASSSDTLYAIDAASGTKLWSASVGAGSPPVVANGVVYIDATDNQLHAFNATTGSELWSVGVGAWWLTPAVANGVVYIGSGTGGTLHAFNATTGSEVWAAPVGAWPQTYASVAVANGVVYIATDKLYAFNATTGSELWSDPVSVPSATPAVANGVVYIVANDGKLHAFNATTGSEFWSTGVDGTWTEPIVANGVVYLGERGTLHAFDATTGGTLWSQAIGGSNVPVAPAVANGVVFASAYDITGGSGGNNGFITAYNLPVPGAGLTMSPAFVPDYGTVLDGTSAGPATFTVTNFGSSATTAITDTFTGADPSQFRVTSDSCAGQTLAGGASCIIGVAFAPTLPGVRKANLAVNAATGGSVAATLSGTGNAFSIDPTGKDYGSVAAGTSSPPTTFTVTNRSQTTVTPTIASLAGSQFTASSDTCSGATLAAGATCNIAVAFTPPPNAPVPDEASATLSASAAGVTTSASLSGTVPPLAIVPANKDYGTVPVGSSSSATFTITNVSSAQVAFLPSVVGSPYSITSDDCPAGLYTYYLNPGASCTNVVTFAPSVSGTFDGQLTETVYSPGNWSAQASLVGVGASVSVVVPSNGASVSGTSSVLDAVPSGGATQVVFEVIGGSVNAMVADGTPSLYGWLATWNTTAVPDGTYTLEAQASYAGGVTVTSPGIQITVNN